MRLLGKFAAVTALCGCCLAVGWSQERPSRTAGSKAMLQSPAKNHSREDYRSLSHDDRQSLIAAALDARVRRNSESDCSHLVHAIYEEAGLPYSYAPSTEIYAGIEGFQRVKSPQPGDLVVWRGHVGMVIKPSQHIFFSFMSSGPGTDNYYAPYWKGRGHPRFYRYLKN